jgi:hypothetical protein
MVPSLGRFVDWRQDMQGDLRAVLQLALRLQGARGRHRELMRRVVFWLLLAQLLAGQRGGRPARSTPLPARDERPVRGRVPRRGSLAGRRPRG